MSNIKEKWCRFRNRVHFALCEYTLNRKQKNKCSIFIDTTALSELEKPTDKSKV